MNIVDLVIVVCLGLGLLIGWYHGFLRAAANLGALLLALVIALAGHGAMARGVLSEDKLIPQMIYYSESDEFLGDIEAVRMPVDSLTPQLLDACLEEAALPHPVEARLRANVEGRVFAEVGLTQLGEYLSMTIAHFSVNVGCFLILFVLSLVILFIVVQALDATLHLPILRYGDSVAGAGMGLLVCGMLLFAVFTLVPVGLSYVPFEEIAVIVDNSSAATLFYRSNFILSLMSGFIG